MYRSTVARYFRIDVATAASGSSRHRSANDLRAAAGCAGGGSSEGRPTSSRSPVTRRAGGEHQADDEEGEGGDTVEVGPHGEGRRKGGGDRLAEPRKLGKRGGPVTGYIGRVAGSAEGGTRNPDIPNSARGRRPVHGGLGMAVRRIPVVALLVGACTFARGQDPVPVPVLPPAARLVPAPGTATVAEPVAPPCWSSHRRRPRPRKPCLPCHTEYQPNHVYLPDANPDFGAGGCDGECRPCRRDWVSLAFFVGGSQNLGDIDRGHECGCRARGGYWFDDSKTLWDRRRLAQRPQAVPRNLL